MAAPDLTPRQRDLVQAVLAPFAARIDRVDVFGSRAMGTARPNSDINLAIRGQLSEAEVDRLWTLFDDSYLAVGVDVLAYERVGYPPLRAHIDDHGVPLFTKADLLAGALPA